MRRTVWMMAVLLGAAGCASAPETDMSDLGFDMGRVSQAESARLAARFADKPLGSVQNPVRADMPAGQQAYLRRLRCSDGRAPGFGRIGSFGAGPYGSIIDGYSVSCGGSSPAQSEIYMDMYHAGHVEAAAVPGFTIVP
ncbi:hypothetical protein [Brevundimonas sp.]|uniref:hypothetical protein n=1 Tax=Brevundimonas sp. TaxID=1871086 RepID=UPI0011F5258F|nr:hypothetical protein [Brevundimonas sp.]TAJ64632.1 MAG: hypothetical protein EPO49_04930 [Brevundimonas sp.]